MIKLVSMGGDNGDKEKGKIVPKCYREGMVLERVGSEGWSGNR